MVAKINHSRFDHDVDSFIQAPICPHKRLLQAMLIRTIKDLFDRSPKIQLDAITYILTKKRSFNYPLSFDWTCQELGIDGTTLKNLIKKHRYNLEATGLRELVQNR